jgi:hypothetical protein
MKKTIAWIVGIVFGILLLAGLFLPWIFGGAGYGMHPYGGMMGRGYGYMQPFGWGIMGLGWLFMLAVLVLLGLGIASLIKYLSAPKPDSTPKSLPPSTQNCSNCGRPSQPDWNTCPYCGNNLREKE